MTWGRYHDILLLCSYLALSLELGKESPWKCTYWVQLNLLQMPSEITKGNTCLSTVRITQVLWEEFFCSWLYDGHIRENTMIPWCKLALCQQGNQGPLKAVLCVFTPMEKDLNLAYGFWAYAEELPNREVCLLLDLITKASSGNTFPQAFITGWIHAGVIGPQDPISRIWPQMFFAWTIQDKGTTLLWWNLRRGERLHNLPEEILSMFYRSNLEKPWFYPMASSPDINWTYFLLLVLWGHGAYSFIYLFIVFIKEISMDWIAVLKSLFLFCR